uniref:putative per-hexamer repeat protein 5 n=1 Tax=Pristiophorus japonicus TaxID=55135 RepID=UPI00398E317D
MSDPALSRTGTVRVAAQPAATRGTGSQHGGGLGTGVTTGKGKGKGKGKGTGTRASTSTSKVMNTAINTGRGVNTGIGTSTNTGKDTGVSTGKGAGKNAGKDTGEGAGKGTGTGVNIGTGKGKGTSKGTSTVLRSYAATHQKATPQKSAQKTTHSYGAYSVTVPDQKKRSDLQKKAAAELAALEKLKRQNIGHVSITPSTVGGTLTQEEVRRKQQLDFSKAETMQAEQSGQQSPA